MAKPTQTKTASKAQAPQQEPSGNLPALAEEANAFRKELALREKAYARLLPSHINWDRFQASVWAAVQNNPDLLKCNRATLFKACAEAAELGLSLNPSLREADILKVWDGRINSYAAQFRPRFMGYMKLAKQSGEIKNITATEVYAWDEFDYERGLNERLVHRPAPKPMDYDKREYWGVIYAYCIWTEADGTKKFEVMDLPDIIRIMNRSSSKDRTSGEIKGPWVTDFPEMCRKTVVRRSSKYMPLSAEKMKPFAAAVNLDDRREGGENVELRDGDVIDITESEPAPEQPKQTPAGKSQMDDLESRMAAPQSRQQSAPAPKAAPPVIDNPPQQQQAIARIEAPIINGGKDLVAWLQLSEAALRPMDSAQRAAWQQAHKDLLDSCEFTVPDKMDELYRLLPKA